MVLTLSHFNAALLFSIFASTVFAITQRTTTREMFRYGLYCFSLFMGFEHHLPRNSVCPVFRWSPAQGWTSKVSLPTSAKLTHA